jgi:hypothetical protein
MARAPGKDMAIDIAVWLLGSLESRDNVIDEFFQLRIVRLPETGRGCFQPFGQIGIPENAPAPVPIVTHSSPPMHLLVESQGINLTFTLQLVELMEERGGPYQIPPLFPKTIDNRDSAWGNGRPTRIHRNTFHCETGNHNLTDL